MIVERTASGAITIMMLGAEAETMMAALEHYKRYVGRKASTDAVHKVTYNEVERRIAELTKVGISRNSKPWSFQFRANNSK